MIPEIPLVNVGRGGAVAVAKAHPEKLVNLLEEAKSVYTAAGISLGDNLSKSWLEKANNPYAGEMTAIAEMLRRPGAHALNMSYEWACTSGVSHDVIGNQLLRILDWSLTGLGSNLVVAEQETDAGVYYNITWPGYTGVLTAMAPKRFAASINQPPMRTENHMTYPLDWITGKFAFFKENRDLPPAHLLRKVFETAKSFNEAKQMLVETPICMPVFYTLCGINPGEGCVIERTENKAMVHDLALRSVGSVRPSIAVANSWIGLETGGISRGYESDIRRKLMIEVLHQSHEDLDWVVYPLVNETTRLVTKMNPAEGTMILKGYESQGPVTKTFRLKA